MIRMAVLFCAKADSYSVTNAVVQTLNLLCYIIIDKCIHGQDTQTLMFVLT